MGTALTITTATACLSIRPSFMYSVGMIRAAPTAPARPTPATPGALTSRALNGASTRPKTIGSGPPPERGKKSGARASGPHSCMENAACCDARSIFSQAPRASLTCTSRGREAMFASSLPMHPVSVRVARVETPVLRLRWRSAKRRRWADAVGHRRSGPRRRRRRGSRVSVPARSRPK